MASQLEVELTGAPEIAPNSRKILSEWSVSLLNRSHAWLRREPEATRLKGKELEVRR